LLQRKSMFACVMRSRRLGSARRPFVVDTDVNASPSSRAFSFDERRRVAHARNERALVLEERFGDRPPRVHLSDEVLCRDAHAVEERLAKR